MIAIPLLGIYPREMNVYVYNKTFTKKFVAALFIIAFILNYVYVCPQSHMLKF